MKLRADDGRSSLRSEGSAPLAGVGVTVISGTGRCADGCGGGGMAAFAACSRAACSAFSLAAAWASASFLVRRLRASADRSRFNRASLSFRSFSARASASSSSRALFRAPFCEDFRVARCLVCDAASSSYSLPSSPPLPCASDSGSSASMVGWTVRAGDALVPLKPALVRSLPRRRASAATLSLWTAVKISAAALVTFPPPPTSERSGSWVIGEPYEVLYLAGTAVLAISPRAGVEALDWGAGEGLAVARTARLGAIAAVS